MNDSKPAYEFAAKLERVYFVYDRKSGDVLGFHPIWTVRGGKLPKTVDLERSIRSHASGLLKGRPGECGIAFLTGKDFDPAGSYRFDLHAKCVVTTPRPREAKSSRRKDAIAAGKPPAVPGLGK